MAPRAKCAKLSCAQSATAAAPTGSSLGQSESEGGVSGRPGPAHPPEKSQGNAVTPGNRPARRGAAAAGRALRMRGHPLVCSKVWGKEKITRNSRTVPVPTPSTRRGARLPGRLHGYRRAVLPRPPATGTFQEARPKLFTMGVLTVLKERALCEFLNNARFLLPAADAGSGLAPLRRGPSARPEPVSGTCFQNPFVSTTCFRTDCRTGLLQNCAGPRTCAQRSAAPATSSPAPLRRPSPNFPAFLVALEPTPTSCGLTSPKNTHPL